MLFQDFIVFLVLMLFIRLMTTHIDDQCIDIDVKKSDNHRFAFDEIFCQKLPDLSQVDDLRVIHD